MGSEAFQETSVTGTPTIVVAKSANETVNNSSTLQDDNDLLYAMAASTSYFFSIFLILTGASTTADWKFGWTVPASATMFWGPMAAGVLGTVIWANTGAASSPAAFLTEGSTLVNGGINGTHGLALFGIVRNSSTAGNLQFQWAQNTPTVEDNVINKDSLMLINKIQ